MIAFTSPSSRAPLVVLAAAMLASACSSVDLGPRYDPKWGIPDSAPAYDGLP